MPNYVPYLLLTIVSITILIITIIHKRQFGLMVLFLCFSGIVYVAEFFVWLIGNSYYYYPDVLYIQYYDNALGAVISNLFVIPVFGVVAGVYQLRFRWLVFIVLTLVGIEWLFEWLDIYQVNWWRNEYTFISLLLFFLLAKYWMRGLQLGTKWLHFLSLWMQGWGAGGTVMYVMSVADIFHYQLGIFENVYRDDLFISAIMGLIKSLVFVIAIMHFRKLRWRLLAPLLVYGIDLPLYFLGIFEVEIQFWLYTIIYLMLTTFLLWWNQYANSFLYKLAR